MPRIRCHYTDCVFVDDGYCGAAAVELDPDTGCATYSPNAEAAAAKGVIPPDFILDKAIVQLSELHDTADGKLRLAIHLDEEMHRNRVPGDWSALAASVVHEKVHPALERQIGTLKSLRAKAVHDAGVWRLPDGDHYYSWALRLGTTTNLSPDEVHQIGLDQVKEIAAKLDGLLKALKEEGVEIDPHREDADYGRFAWIMDPEGNRIELWEPPAGG